MIAEIEAWATANDTNRSEAIRRLVAIGKMTDARWVEATRELCDDLDCLIDLAKQGRVPVRAISLIERARAELEVYLDEINAAALVGLGLNEWGAIL